MSGSWPAASSCTRSRTTRPARCWDWPRLRVGGAQGLVFAPDGHTLAWGSFTDGLFLWDCTAGKEPRRLQADRPDKRYAPTDLESLAFAPDGKTLAASRSDGTVQLW